MTVDAIERWNLTLPLGHELEMIEPHLDYSGKVLDYGAGLGRIMAPLAKAHPEAKFIGYDPEPELMGMRDSLDNGSYAKVWRNWKLSSAYSVLVFQHLPDSEVSKALERVHPTPFRFQFVEGELTHVDNYQRSADHMSELVYGAGYETIGMERDPVYPEWRWVTAW